MEFFNKKEEVLEFQLTNYGRDRLAVGKLNPTYYAFFDDDILYDSEAAGFIEFQNNVEGRIQSDTPKMKVVSTREGAETRVGRFINNVSAALNPIGGPTSDPADNVEVFKAQVYGEKGKLDAYPLGRSSLNKDKLPAWNMQILSNPSASSSQTFLNEEDFIQAIPQVNITIDYQTYFDQGPFTSEAITEYLPGQNAADIFLALKENYLMIELLEENTEFEKENFEIEVFQSSSSGYQQLGFTAESANTFVTPKPDNIGYYMNILTDREIPNEILEELNINQEALGTAASRIKLNRDIYTTDNEEPC